MTMENKTDHIVSREFGVCPKYDYFHPEDEMCIRGPENIWEEGVQFKIGDMAWFKEEVPQTFWDWLCRRKPKTQFVMKVCTENFPAHVFK